MLNVYQHHHANIKMPVASSIAEVRGLAEAAAQLGHTALYRAFKVIGPDREQFETAFSVVDGHVTEHRDVSIPEVHF